MKKILALILALALCLGLMAGCGSDSAPESSDANAPSNGAAGDSDAKTPADDDDDDDDAGDAAGIDPLTISFSTTFQQTETGGEIIQYFIDAVDRLSDGAIDVNITWGGTLFDSMGELDAVSDGAVNMLALGHMPHTGVLNYLGFPGFAPGGTKAAVDYFREIMFNNPETSALVEEEAAAHGIKYLNITASGTNAICAKYEFADLDSLVAGSAAFGNFFAAQWEYLGFQVTPLPPPDIYDGLNRGLIDATQMGFAPMVMLTWYEVAPYWALDGTYAAGNPFTVNLDWWNTLTQAQQQCIQEAADEVEAFSIVMYDDVIAQDIATVEEATGNKFVDFSDEDIARLWDSCFVAVADAALANAKANGKTEGMVKVLQAAAAFTDYDWSYEG